MTADTVVPDPTKLQTFNRYSYVLNNPIRYTDPTGHYPDETDGSNANDFDGGQDSDGDWNGSRSGRKRRERERNNDNSWSNFWYQKYVNGIKNSLNGLDFYGNVLNFLLNNPVFALRDLANMPNHELSALLKEAGYLERSEVKKLSGKEFEDWLALSKGGEGSFKTGGREFDGKKNNQFGKDLWWEAKSGNYWKDYAQLGEKFDKFKSDMGARLSIAKRNGANYRLYSNSSIPTHVKEWLDIKGIKYTEY